MSEEYPRRFRLISAFLSVGIHAAILLIGGSLLIRQAEFSVQEGEGSTQVDMVAAPAPAEAVPFSAQPPSQNEPQIREIQNPEDVVQPKPQLQKEKPSPPKPTHPAPKVAPSKPSAAVGDGSSAIPGQDATTAHAGQSGAVSAKPDYLRNPIPRYPESAREAHQEGVVMLMVEVGENGQALSVEVKQTSGYKILDSAAVEAVKGWRFKPGTMGGIPVKSRAEVPVRFRLEQH